MLSVVILPVLKHGPRSRRTRRASEWKAHTHSASEGWRGSSHILGPKGTYESRASDPKDGDLYVTRAKSGETLMEVRKRPDLRIGVLSCVKGRKTHRTV